MLSLAIELQNGENIGITHNLFIWRQMEFPSKISHLQVIHSTNGDLQTLTWGKLSDKSVGTGCLQDITYVKLVQTHSHKMVLNADILLMI